MIVNDIGKEKPNNGRREFDVMMPKIVNGCQTVSTIYETLSGLPVSTLEKDFENTYIMVKILKIPSNDDKLKKLYADIVRYNNSQNAINEKTFTANTDVFKRVKTEFGAKGLLVCIKQSDKYQFKTKYKSPTTLINLNNIFMKRFGLEDLKKTSDFIIELEKLLQVFVAFEHTPLSAVQNKARLLQQDSSQNKQVVDFIKNPVITSNDMVNLYLLYLRAEKDKNASQEKRVPNPFYLIYCFSRYECQGDPTKISLRLESKDEIDYIMKKYKLTLSKYYRKWTRKNPGKEYNDMIKSQIDIELLDEVKADAEDSLMYE